MIPNQLAKHPGWTQHPCALDANALLIQRVIDETDNMNAKFWMPPEFLGNHQTRPTGPYNEGPVKDGTLGKIVQSEIR